MIDGEVYDIGELIRVHPGGNRILQLYAGMDATQGFARAHAHRPHVDAMRARYRIGLLRDDVLDNAARDVHRAFAQALQLVVEMQNALAAEYSLQTEPITRDDGARVPTPYKLARASETHVRFCNDYLGLLCAETLPALWRVTRALFPSAPSEWTDALAVARPLQAGVVLKAEDARTLEHIDRELLASILVRLVLVDPWREDVERMKPLEKSGVDAAGDADEPGSGVRKIRDALRAPSESAHGDVPPRHIGPYRLLECIGEGAMGHVYRAEHTLLGRVVAIKMLRSELSGDEACVRRFLAEARAVNLIKHPHIIDVTDFACTEQGQPWFVMEMLEGSDLALAAERQPLSLERTLEIVRQLCEALVSVHTAGVIHRDVKPENIFLQQRDGQDFVTLLDFGIARLPDPTNADPLQEGLMGTAFYMAPEQASASPIDHRADLYAVGSTLFELIAGIGHTPFREELLQKQLMELLLTPAPRLSDRATVPAIVRADLDRLIARLLAKHPSDRPASAREVADEIARIAKKLHDSKAIPRPASAPLALRTSVPVVARPHARDQRKRARRRAAHERSVQTTRTAIILSALFAAAAIWIATSEGSWVPVLVRTLSWPDRTTTRSLPGEHIVQPLTTATEAASTGAAPPPETAPSVPETSVTVDADQAPKRGRAARNDDGNPRRTQRAARAKEPAEREAAREPQPSLTIAPSAPPPAVAPPSSDRGAEERPRPREEPAAADDEPSYDRDLVLNPF